MGYIKQVPIYSRAHSELVEELKRALILQQVQDERIFLEQLHEVYLLFDYCHHSSQHMSMGNR